MNLYESYCFDDILIDPMLSKTKTRNDISLDINLGRSESNRHLILKTPLISSPMDTVTEQQMAIAMALNGGIGIIHRFMSIDNQVSQIKKVKRYLQYIIEKPYCIEKTETYVNFLKFYEKVNVSSFCVCENDKLIGIMTKRDIDYMNYIFAEPGNSTDTTIENFFTKNPTTLTLNNTDTLETIIKRSKELMLLNKIEKIPLVDNDNKLKGMVTLKNVNHYFNNKLKACVDNDGALCVGAAIGLNDDDRLDKLVNAGADLICLDVANGFNTNVKDAIINIRHKYKDVILMVGNVCNKEGFEYLCQTDVDCIRVGIGNGSICSTRLETGIGKGQFSAVMECFDAMPPTHYPKIICDGGSLGKTGNKFKALAAGASAIMLGRTLASTFESPGEPIVRNGKQFKYIRGMASTMANISKQENLGSKDLKTNFTAEGVDGEQPMSGNVVTIIEQITGGLKSGLSYLGSDNISELHYKRKTNQIKFNVVTAIGMTETGIRVKTY